MITRNLQCRARCLRTVLAVLAAALILLSGGAVSCGAEEEDRTPLTNLIPGWPEMDYISEGSAVVMDAETGGILYSLNRNEIRYPASITKILTALVTLENASLDEIVTMDETGLQYVEGGSSHAQTVAGEEFTVEQCLYIMMLKSANDIATQLGKHVGGGDFEHFVEMMNAKAASLGCTDTHFTNACGMPDSEHYTTAEDMARIMRSCIQNEMFCKIIGTVSYTVPPTNMTSTERTYDNHCRLILPDSEFYYSPCIGGKTGYTDAALRTLVCAAKKDGKTLVAVTMKGESQEDFWDMQNLFEYGFSNFEETELDGVQCDLPAGFDTELLSEETMDLEGGGQKVVWKYNNTPVGEKLIGVPTPTPVPQLTPEPVSEVEMISVTEIAPEEQTEKVPVVKRERSTIPQILFSAVLVLLLLFILGCVAAYYINKKYGDRIRLELERRRRRARKGNAPYDNASKGRSSKKRTSGKKKNGRKASGKNASGRAGSARDRGRDDDYDDPVYESDEFDDWENDDFKVNRSRRR